MPVETTKDSINPRDEAVRQQEEQWYNDAEKLLTLSSRITNDRKRVARTSAAVAAVAVVGTADKDGLHDSDRHDDELQANAFGSAPVGHSITASEEGDLQLRQQSVQFLTWQQAQLKKDLERRNAVARAKREELCKAQEKLSIEEAAHLERAAQVRAKERQLRDMADYRTRDVQDRWEALDAAENIVLVSGRKALESALEYEQRGEKLIEAQGVLAIAEQQAQQMKLEKALLQERERDMEAREAALQCMQGAWSCGVMQSLMQCCGEMGLDDDILIALRENVAQQVTDEIVRRDPLLGRLHSALCASVLSSVGGHQLSDARTGVGTNGSDHGCRPATPVESVRALTEERVGRGSCMSSAQSSPKASRSECVDLPYTHEFLRRFSGRPQSVTSGYSHSNARGGW